MKYEGHLFIWFTILMPFAKNNLFYPYSMQIINWLFCFGAILVMWRFAPFNSYIKSCITLSLPFKIYSQLARCYSLGIFFLFILASLYPKRLEHPIIYAILILVIANTSIMALVGAFAFGVIFLFDLFNSLKNNGISKKLFIFIFILFFLGAVLVLGQLVNFSIPFYAVNSRFYNFNTNFLCFYLDAPVSIFKIIFATLYSFLLIFSSLFFKKDTKILFFLFLTQLLLIVIFSKVYAGECWHFCFLFIYFIISVWLYLSECKLTSQFQKNYIMLFFVFCFLLIFFPSNYKTFIGIHSGLRYYVENNIDTFNSSKIFFFPNHSYTKEIVPYIDKYNLDMYDSHGNQIKSLDAFFVQWKDDIIDFQKIKEIIGNDSYAFIFTDLKSNQLFMDRIKNTKLLYGLQIDLYRCILPSYLYIIKKI